MNTSRLCALRVGTVLLLAGLAGLAPPNARGQFATLLDTTSRYAGNSTGTDPFNGDTGVATATSLNVPSYVVFDSLGDLYISDTLNNCVRKVDTSGNITTVAGLRINGGPDTCNTTSNPAPDPTQGLLAPTGLAIDGSNTLYIADSQHNCVRSLASGAVDSYATPSLNRVAGTCTFVNTSSVTPVPDGLAVDSSSNLYISIVDSLTAVPVYQVVRHLASDPATTICAVAGETSANAATTLCPGIANTVKLVRPAGLVFDKNGNLFIADSGNDCVREIAGMTTQQTAVGQCINDLTGSTATVLNNPYGLSFSSDASLYISESALTQNNIVSFNSGSNTLSPIAGRPSGLSGPYNVSQEGQPALLVPLNQPLGITSDTGGSVYIADSQNNVVRKMSRDLSFPNTIVGQTSPTQIILFSINQTVNLTVTVGTDYNLVSSSCRGPLASASVGQPPNTCQVVVSFTPSRSGFRYSALQLRDSISGQLLSVELEGVGIGPLSLLAPGVASSVTSGLRTAVAVSTDSAGGAYVLERGSGSSVADVLYYPAGGGAPRIVVAQGAGMVTPTAMAVDGAGNIFIADPGVAGFGGGNILRFGADGSVNTAYATGLAGVNAMAVDGFDDLFLAIGGSFHNITEIYAGGTRSVVAGDGSVADSNGVPAINALFIDPSAVALGPNGTISIADAGTHYVYLIDSAGNIHIVAGNGTTATTSAGVATGTGLVTPDALAVDAAGDIYIADDSANIVYAVYSVISNGTNILPVIGTGTAGYTGDGGPSIAATINAPLAIALDGSSDLFVIDSGNNALREVSYPRTSTIGFGNVLIGTTAGPILQYLANAGNANLMFTTPFTTTDAHYAVSTNPTATTCTGTMAAGGVCSIGYTYTPTPPAGPAPAGQSNLFSNSYNSQQTVFFSTSGSYGYSTQSLPYTLLPETEMYGYPFPESLTLNLIYPFIDPTGAMSFSTGAKTLCTVAGPFSRTVVCNAPESGLNVGLYTVNFTYTTGDLNYSSVIGSTGLQITQAPLTVTPNNITRMYGQGNPTLTGSVVGAVNGDVFNVTYSTTATQFSPVGNYPITATLTPVGSASLSNYAVTYNVGTLTVTQASGAAGLVVTVNNATRPYGTPNPTFTGIVTGLVNGDSVTVSYSTAATQFSPVGGYAITATVSGAAAANYAVTVIPGTLTIAPAGTGGGNGLLVTVNNVTRPYGTANPTFTGSISGLLNGDTVTVTYSTTATILSPVGNYPITAVVSGPSAANYVVTVVPGTLTITTATAPLVVTVYSASRQYGTANPAFTGTVAGALNGDNFTVNYSTTATLTSPVGSYPITATLTPVGTASLSNYSTSYTAGTLTVTPAPLTVTPNNITRMYGQGNPTFTGSVVGVVNGDVFNVTYSTTATQFSPVGNYPITATLTPVGTASLNNYSVNYNVGTLTVTQASGAAGLVVTVNNATRPYGTVNPGFTGVVTGLVNGDSVTVSYSTAATQFSPVGGYAITATVSGAAAANYAVTVIPGTLTITPATTPLVVTVNNATRPYGTANPTFTDSVSGLIPGDSVTVTYLTAATQFSPVGGYPITAVVSGPSAASYAVTVIPGTLTVTPSAIPVVITVNNSSRSYGTANPPFTNSMAGALNGDSFVLNYSTPATVLSDVGNYSISATVSGPSVANYTTISVVPGTLAITPDATVTTVTTSASPVNQGTNITFTATVTFGAGLPVPATTVNFYNGATLLGTGTLNLSGVATFSTSSLTAGTYTIMAIYQATRDFASSSGTVGQVVNPGTFTLTATPPSQFIRGPGNTVYAVSVSSVQGFEGPVKLTCTGLPTDATCVFATPTVNLTIGGTASTTMTVVSTEADARLALPALQIPAGRTPGGLSPIAFAAVFPFGVGAFFAGVLRRKRGAQAGGARASRSPKIRLLLALFCTVGIVSLTGCACITSVYQVYTVPITGTDSSGMITQTTGTASNSPSVTLTVAQQ